MSLNEYIVEDAAFEWFGGLGYAVCHGPHLALGESAAERHSFAEVVQPRYAQTLHRPLPAAISASLRFPRGEENREAIRWLKRSFSNVFQQ